MIKIKDIRLFDTHIYQAQKKAFKLRYHQDGQLIKSKARVQQHGEVFTPKWMVKKMLETPTIQEKIKDLHATFLEPSAGEGAFLTEILHQKLSYIDKVSKKKDWQNNALWALMSIYAIEFLKDNVVKARQAMVDVLINHYQHFFKKELSSKIEFYKSAKLIIRLNIIQGDTLKYKQQSGEPIIFNEWQAVSKNEVLRIPFNYQSLFNNNDQLEIFSKKKQTNIFGEEETNVKKYKIMKVTKVYKEELE